MLWFFWREGDHGHTNSVAVVAQVLPTATTKLANIKMIYYVHTFEWPLLQMPPQSKRSRNVRICKRKRPILPWRSVRKNAQLRIRCSLHEKTDENNNHRQIMFVPFLCETSLIKFPAGVFSHGEENCSKAKHEPAFFTQVDEFNEWISFEAASGACNVNAG